jgi:hypothetical protein
MYNPSLHTATNKPIGLISKPVDARTYYYDSVNFVYRAYVSEAEVLAYLTTDESRTGQFSIIINTDGSLSNGVITGGVNSEWWFKNGVSDDDLKLKHDAPQEVEFTAATGIVINWQTDDIITGTTYADYFGNTLPKPAVYINTGVTDEVTKKDFDLKIIRTTGLITTVTFDWATSETGYIIF